jgi:hypothetical protein
MDSLDTVQGRRAAILELDGRRFTVASGMTLRDGIKHAGLQTEAVLALYEGRLITDDVILKPGMQVRLAAVNCGGGL